MRGKEERKRSFYKLLFLLLLPFRIETWCGDAVENGLPILSFAPHPHKMSIYDCTNNSGTCVAIKKNEKQTAHASFHPSRGRIQPHVSFSLSTPFTIEIPHLFSACLSIQQL
jgi:hypothetical protein